MSSIFQRLGFNFDTNRFGDAQYLSPGAEAYLNSAPIQLASWQQSDIANGNIQTTNYYKNPLANDCTLLIANTSNIATFAATVPFDFAGTANITLLNTATKLQTELNSFVSHTNNVSGVSLMTSNTDVIPSLESATSIGNYLLRIVNVSDDVQNTTPLLGSMTCLFVSTEISSNVSVVNTALQLLNSSVAPNGNCYLSSVQVLSISNSLNVLNTFVSYRRTSDWNFFANATSIVMDTVKLSAFNNMGNTQLYLVNNLIGTDQLKSNLANTPNMTI